MQYSNPVIPGFNPDPSVCRVGQDFYLVTSTFEYFPGVPVYHSRDLINWQCVGHCLTRLSQLPLAGAGCSGGIFAPTIRHHDGVFYMVTTNVSGGGNFFVKTDDPAGEWSEPVWLEQSGIDPSLFFDDDERVYLESTGHGGIQQSQIDIETGKLLCKPRVVWSGTGGRHPEAPHLYKINGVYYLMIAEGGTEYGHMETIARAEDPWGPFEPCPHNPILTHRDHGGSQVQGTGHADLFQAADSSWWLVFLAFRIVGGQFHHLGRETFLAPVRWNDAGWPVVAENGRVSLQIDAPLPPASPFPAEPALDDFDDAKLRPCWNFLRNPDDACWSLTERPGFLTLHGLAATLNDTASPAFIGRRQQHFDARASAMLEFDPAADGDEAGVTALIDAAHHYDLAVIRQNGRKHLIVRRRIGDLSAVVAQVEIDSSRVLLEIRAESQRYSFLASSGGGNSFSASGGNSSPCLLATASTRYLSTEVAGGFTGVYLGMYATGNGRPCAAPAAFDWFSYEPSEAAARI